MAKKEKLDKWGTTIGVKHFLNHRLKGIVGESENKYPIYVQITVKGQSIKVRSTFNLYFTDEEFEIYRISNGQDLKNEEIIIRRGILSQNPFEDPNFVLKWSWRQHTYFTFYDYEDELNDLVNTYLNRSLEEAIDVYSDKMVRYERFWRRAETNNLPCTVLTDDEYEKADKFPSYTDLDYVEFFKINKSLLNTSEVNYYSMFMSFFIPQVKSVRDEFPPEFWDFTNYFYKIRNVNNVNLIIIDDLFTGRFDELFMTAWHDENALNAIRMGFDVLFSKYPELHSRVDVIRQSYAVK